MKVSRRDALAGITLAAGAAILPGGCTPVKGSEKKSLFRYSLNTSTISGNSLGILEYIDITAEAGYDYIEIWVSDVESYLDQGNTTSTLKSYIQDSGLRVASAIGFAPWMTGKMEGMEQMEKEMHMLAEIGCPRIAAPPSGMPPEEALNYEKVAALYAELLELGRSTGVMPQLEFWGSSPVLWHLGQVLMIAAMANDADARILPDVYHLFRGGSGFKSLNMLSGELIDLFHFNDYPTDIPRTEQVDSDRVYPGDGSAPISDILTILMQMGREKILSLELFNPMYWKEDPLTVAKTGLSKMKELVKGIS